MKWNFNQWRFPHRALVTIIAASTLISSTARGQEPPRVASTAVTNQADKAPRPPVLTTTPTSVAVPLSSLSERWGDNVRAQISSRILKQFMERSVSDQRVIQENVLGAQSVGQAFTTGKITIDLIPFPERVLLDIHFTGRTDVPANVSQRGPVSIYSSCNTNVDARKPVYVDADGIHPAAAYAQCASSVQVADIAAKRRLIEKIGWRKTDRMHGQMEQAASERAQVRSAQQLDEQANSLLTEADRAFREKFRDPLKQRGAFPTRMHFSSTASHLHLTALEATGSQRGATSSPTVEANHDLAIAAHESFLENLVELTLAGKKVTDQQFLGLMKLMTGDSPRPLWIHDHTPRWDVTLAKQKPLTIKLENGRATATIAFEQASRDDEQLGQPFQVSFVYRPELAQGVHRMIREGALRVEFSDRAATDVSTDMQSFITKKLAAVFQEEIYFDGLVPPAGGTWGKLRQVQAKECRSDNGWLVLGYQLKE